MTVNQIEEIVMKHYSQLGHTPITTRFTGMGIGEADVISITKAGFISEFEIKCSRNDYLADFRNKGYKHKAMLKRAGVKVYPSGEVWYKSANKFWFVVPENLIMLHEIPEYAGLIYISENHLSIIKNAPRLHKHKATESLYKKIAHNLMNKLIYGCSYMNYRRKENQKILEVIEPPNTN